MRIEFVVRDGGPERLAAEAEIHFDGDLAGLKLTGFSVWLSPEGEHFVTFPSRAFGAGCERRYFDFLRSADGGLEPTRALKATIRDAFATWRAAQA